MNFLAHAQVALASGRDDPLYVLGAVLPDLTSMSGVRLQRDRLDGHLADGVRCHHAADRDFHSHPVFRQGSAAIRSDLTGAGLSSGPARAIGHVAWEMLADGTLLRTAAETAYWDALDHGEAALVGIDEPAHRQRWASFLSYRDQRPRLGYDDPVWVAERVRSMLSRRPRLAFPQAQVPVVAAVLDAHLAGVVGAAAGVLADVTAPQNARGERPGGRSPQEEISEDSSWRLHAGRD